MKAGQFRKIFYAFRKQFGNQKVEIVPSIIKELLHTFQGSAPSTLTVNIQGLLNEKKKPIEMSLVIVRKYFENRLSAFDAEAIPKMDFLFKIFCMSTFPNRGSIPVVI